MNGNTVSQLVLYIIRFFIFCETRASSLIYCDAPRSVKEVRKSYKFKTEGESGQRATNSCSLVSQSHPQNSVEYLCVKNRS